MNILVISNMYPPYYVGGFELTTQDAVNGLESGGHVVTILTSTYLSGHRTDGNVLRWLPDPLKRHPNILELLKNQLTFKLQLLKAIRLSKPDLIIVTGMNGFSTSFLCSSLEKIKTPVVYAIFDLSLLDYSKYDSWYRFWNNYSHRTTRAIIKRLGRSVIQLLGLPADLTLGECGAWFGSRYLEETFVENNISFRFSMLLYPLIPRQLLDVRVNTAVDYKPMKLLFIGRICREKGLDVIIKAFGHLKQEGLMPLPNLSVVGRLLNDEFEHELRALIMEFNLSDHVSFLGHVDRSKIADVFQDHDCVVFATVIDEPFGMVPLEAMAASRPVIATATGGAREYLQDNMNSLIFTPGDATELAEKIMLLTQDLTLRSKLAYAGHNFAIPFADAEGFISHLEKFLYSVMASISAE
jgi:glycogen synthase